MTLLIDANILLDVLQAREPHVHNSSLVWKLCETGQIRGVVCTFSFLNLIYIMRKQMSPERVETMLKQLSLIFKFADLLSSDISHAASMRWDDFEDAVQSSAASRLHADYIITRNTQDYEDSPVPALSPVEFLSIIRNK